MITSVNLNVIANEQEHIDYWITYINSQSILVQQTNENQTVHWTGEMDAMSREAEHSAAKLHGNAFSHKPQQNLVIVVISLALDNRQIDEDASQQRD